MGKWLCMLLTGLLLLTGCSFTHGRFPFQKQAPPRFAVVNWDELVKRHPRYKEWERQKLKLEVKDRLVDYMKDILDGAEDVKETKKRITENRETICLVAEQEIQKQGYTYPVSVNLEKCYFPMKTYGDCTFPAGTYEALRVCIGKAKGRNWWCVLYPGLCFADSVNVIVPDEKKQELKNILTEEEYESLFDWREDDYQIRSGFLRLWRKLFA